ncbi:MAG: hypothetical protein R3D26_17020 [Cyanobacteriota/Melainabacteria group bacterium]
MKPSISNPRDHKGSILKAMVEGKEATSSSYLVEGIGQDFMPGNFDTGAGG